MLPLPKRLRNRRNKANIKGLQRCRSMAKHQRHFLFCPPIAYACFAHLLHMRPLGFHGVR